MRAARRRMELCRLAIIATLVSSGWCHAEPNDRAAPPLGAKAPTDRNGIATDETYYASLKGNPGTLNPILSSTVPEERIKSLLWDYPFVYDHNLEWQLNEAMVESYVEAPDHLSSTLTLKHGLTWHDGHPLTAADVVFSWRQIMDDRVPAVSARTGTDQIAKCIAIDARSVKFIHREALLTNKWNMMFGIIPKHLYAKEKTVDPSLATSDYYVRQNRAPVANGPYRFVKWDTDDKIVLERWDDYPGPAPYFNRVIFRIIPDAHARLLAFERQELDELELTAQQYALETNSQRFRDVGIKAKSPKRNFYYIVWNLDGSNPFFADRRVRRAMSHATHYDRIIKNVFHNLFTRSYGLTDPTQPTFNPAFELFDYNLAEAERLLGAAGWRKDTNDGWRYKVADGQHGGKRTRFTFTLSVPTDSAVKIAAILQADLRKIGVDMNTRRIEWGTFVERIRQHEFQAALSAFTMGVDPDQAWNLFHSESYKDARNYGGYANPRADELFRLGRLCLNESQRMAYYAELFKIIYDDAPCTFLASAPNLWAFNKRIHGVQFSPRGPHTFHPGLRSWWVAKGEAIHPVASP